LWPLNGSVLERPVSEGPVLPSLEFEILVQIRASWAKATDG
jgi:hypothetical protein